MVHVGLPSREESFVDLIVSAVASSFFLLPEAAQPLLFSLALLLHLSLPLEKRVLISCHGFLLGLSIVGPRVPSLAADVEIKRTGDARLDVPGSQFFGKVR